MQPAVIRPLAIVALLLPGSALASVTMGGGTYYWEVNYGSCGTWWNGSRGVLTEDPSTSSSSYGDNDFIDSSDPWTQITLEFDYAGTSYEYDNNDGTGSCDWTMSYEYADSAVGYHFFSAGPIDVVRYESLRLTWALTGGGVPIDRGIDNIVWYEVWNRGATDATDVQFMVALDPDVDVALGGTGTTINDVENVDISDGFVDWAGAVGNTGMTIGFAPCDPETAAIGFGGRSTTADIVLSDPGGAQSDSALYFIQDIGTLGAGQAASFGFVLGMGSDDAFTRDYAVDGAAGNMSFEYCDCDEDSDGFTGAQCGGNDCDDDDSSINPGAVEVWYDGVDSDCDGSDDGDADGDGWTTAAGDCDDTDASTSPGATEVWYDGVDSDCDGADDYDADGDGYRWDGAGGDDCDDGDEDINPGVSTDTWYDGVDEDCSGSDYDADGDGHDSDAHGGGDCDDANPDVNPDATDVWYDGEDTDCNDWDDYDADRDGHAHDGYGGDDCDDTDPDVHPGAEELWYDGIDQDCDESTADDDQDGDGHSLDEDCDDTDGSIWQGCEDDEDEDVYGDGSGLGADEGRSGIDDWKTTGGHGGCGCATTAPERVPWAVGLFALLGTLVRRRR